MKFNVINDNEKIKINLNQTGGNECAYTPAFVPECAKMPVNSLCYSYHQRLETESIIRECALSKELGMDTVIIDDGKLTADKPEALYSSECATLKDKCVTTVYSNTVVNVKTEKAVVVNASGNNSVIIKGKKGKAYKVLSCVGEEIENGKINSDIQEIFVPLCGIVFVE